MSTKIIAGNATNNGASLSGDTDGVLEIATGASQTTAVTFGSDQVASFSAGANGLLRQATTAATFNVVSVDFTGIPSWAKRITIMFDGVSSNGTSPWVVRVGNGSFQTSGYLGAGTTTVTGSTNFTTGLAIVSTVGAASVWRGLMTLVNMGGNRWVSTCVGGFSDGNSTSIAGSSITLSGSLDRLRLTTLNGTDSFDAGVMNVMWEG